MKLGSLFDGSGGFPLAGALFGIEPVWARAVVHVLVAIYVAAWIIRRRNR